MRIEAMFAFAGLLGLMGCGGPSSGSGSGGGPAANLFTGTLSITSALPAGTTACVTPYTVTFTAAGASPHAINAAGGDCVVFVNGDTVAHQPASIGTAACPQLDASAPLTTGQSFTTPPLAGPRTCSWQDSLNPPSTGGAGY